MLYDVMHKMSNRTKRRLCAGLALMADVLMLLATFLLTGGWDFSVVREVATALLLVWLLTGSNAARWIVGILSVAAVFIGIVGAIWLISQRTSLEHLTMIQQSAFGVFVVAVATHGFVAWLLLFQRGPANSKRIAEQAEDGDTLQRPC